VIFSPKRGPILTRGRLQHLIAGTLTPVVGGLVWRYLGSSTFYEGSMIGGAAIGVFAFLWEAATPLLAPHFDWPHRFGDWLDACAYLIGTLGVGVTVGLLGAHS